MWPVAGSVYDGIISRTVLKLSELILLLGVWACQGAQAEYVDF